MQMSQRPELSRTLDGTAFRSFYDLKRGLSISKLLAEKMGSTITAEYENGRLQFALLFYNYYK